MGKIGTIFSFSPFYTCPQPGQAGTKKKLAYPGNYKSQIPNYKTKKVEKKNCL
jgi:hypothetical protein